MSVMGGSEQVCGVARTTCPEAITFNAPNVRRYATVLDSPDDAREPSLTSEMTLDVPIGWEAGGLGVGYTLVILVWANQFSLQC